MEIFSNKHISELTKANIEVEFNVPVYRTRRANGRGYTQVIVDEFMRSNKTNMVMKFQNAQDRKRVYSALQHYLRYSLIKKPVRVSYSGMNVYLIREDDE